MSGLIQVLAPLSTLAGVAGLAIYFYALWRRPKWVRLWDGSALMLVALALPEMPYILKGTHGFVAVNACVVAGLMIVSVAVLSYAALRGRKSWDGTNRRGERRDETWDGTDRRGERRSEERA